MITAVGPVPAGGGKRPPVYVQEDAPRVTYYDVVGTEGALQPFETFTLQRPRSDR